MWTCVDRSERELETFVLQIVTFLLAKQDYYLAFLLAKKDYYQRAFLLAKKILITGLFYWPNKIITFLLAKKDYHLSVVISFNSAWWVLNPDTWLSRDCSC